MEEDVFQNENAANIGDRVSVAHEIDTHSSTSHIPIQELVLRLRNHSSPVQAHQQLADDNGSQRGSTGSPQPEAPSPYQVLNGAGVDPFATMPVELPPNIMALLMEQTRAILLRQITNRYHQNTIASVAAGQMMQMTIHNKALFYSMIAAAMRFFRVSRNETKIPQLEVAVEARSIELLSQEMAVPETALTETNIIAIVACGYCGRTYPMRRGRLPRQSYLKELQDLTIFGKMVVVEAHVIGLSKLIPMLGGIYALKTPGLAQLISFCDLFDCTRKLQQPLVPFVPHTKTFRQYHQSTVMATEHFIPPPELQMIGLGFGTAFWAANSQHDAEVLEVLSQFSEFTILMDNFLAGRCELQEPVELTDLRNFCQHQLMSLPSSGTLEAAGRLDVNAQYESCRLACIAYSLLVVFPLPPTVGLFERLVRRMRSEVAHLSTTQESLNTDQRKLYFWVLAMSVIISTGLPERQYFLAKLSGQVERLGIADWKVALEVLKHFLWHPSTNNKDGLDLWRDLQGIRSGAG